MWRWSSFSCTALIVAFSILHVCGGDPQIRVGNRQINSYSPRMWRWSCRSIYRQLAEGVFSTYVEVIPSPATPICFSHSILHVCGGDPIYVGTRNPGSVYSPRMWRWSSEPRLRSTHLVVFSTYVEVILRHLVQQIASLRILHVCGGDPIIWLLSTTMTTYSPRMWRWSWMAIADDQAYEVFSTYVEVILAN